MHCRGGQRAFEKGMMQPLLLRRLPPGRVSRQTGMDNSGELDQEVNFRLIEDLFLSIGDRGDIPYRMISFAVGDDQRRARSQLFEDRREDTAGKLGNIFSVELHEGKST